MKNLIKTMPIVATAALLVAGAFLFAGCEKKPEEKTPFEHWDISKMIHCHDVDIDSTITSVTDHARTWIALMNDHEKIKQWCPDAPDVDFTNRSLLALSGMISYGIDSVWDNWEQVNDNRYKLTVFVKPNRTAMPGVWGKRYVTSKINSLYDIDISIEIIKRQPK